MSVKQASRTPDTEGKDASAVAEEAAEVAHLAGSAVVTGAVAAVLTVIAIPVSAGLGVLWGAKALSRRIWRG